MKKRNSTGLEIVQFLPDDKLSEFRYMSLRARLQWLEEANVFVRKALHQSERSTPQKHTRRSRSIP